MPSTRLLPGTSRRSCSLIRANEGEKHPAIVGYGAVFFREGDPGTEYQLWSDTYERIMPGAFDRAIREDDCRSFFNHDPNLILGRSTAGTLLLSIDNVGLKYEVEPPDSEPARHVLEAVRRGDVSGSSFMFIPLAATWRELVVGDQHLWYREITEVELWEVGPVVFPAYESTTAGTRDGQSGESRVASGESQPAAAQWRSWYDAHVRSARESFEAWQRGITEAAAAQRTRDRERRQRRSRALGLRLR